MQSVAQHAPEVHRVVFLCDQADGIQADESEFELLPISDLDLPHRGSFLFQYTVIELNTAVKPFVFTTLFDRGFDKVVYLDPDICVFSPLSQLLSYLDESSVLLTPHLTGFLDERHPSEYDILLSGTYNLGFIAIKSGDTAKALIPWWEDKLARYCVVDIAKGLFVDQKWMDLVPAIFENVRICRNRGWNVAYWNLPHRSVATTPEGGLTIDGEPLVFYHFSGISPDARVFSKHQDRYRFSNLPEPIHDLAQDYCTRLRANGAETFAAMSYGFGTFQSGEAIPDVVRKVFKDERTHWPDDFDPTSKEGEAALMDWVNQAAPGHLCITRAARALYDKRPDLKEAFPAVPGRDEDGYAQWLLHHASQEVHLPQRILEGQATLLSQAPRNAATPPQGLLRRSVYSLAWSARKLTYPFTTLAFRQRVHQLLLSKAYKSAPAAQKVSVKTGAQNQNGLNVIGYLKAESGVGQAARSTLKAAEAAHLPHSRINFETGAISRKEAEVELDGAGPQYNINLFHINADQMPVVRMELGDELWQQRYNIATWYWELPEFPEEWQGRFEGLDEIWAASSFCQQAIAARSPVPVVYMPPSITLPEAEPGGRARFNIPDDAFVYLVMADGLSYLERKNPMGAIAAFQQAFPEDDGVRLMIKTINAGDFSSAALKEIQAAADQDSRLILMDAYLSTAGIRALLESVDVLVSLHRSEGFGLHIAEALYCGKPAIVTAWSANMDFTTPANSYLVPARLEPIGQNIGPYKAHQIWAHPDLDIAASHMQTCRTQPDEARARGARGHADIRQHFSPEAIGKRIKERLNFIQQQRIFHG